MHFCYTMGAMIKTIDIAGIQLDNYTVRELIMSVEKEMSDQGFHTIEEVNMDTLMMAETDEVIREALTSADHTVITEAGILEAAGISNYQRRHEIEHRDFFYELMKRIERNHKTIFVIGDTSGHTSTICDKMQNLFPKCEIAGTEALEECMGATDAVVNEINALTPDVIISVLPSPEQEHFLMDNKEKLSASLWYGIGMTELQRKRGRLANGIRNLIRTHKLERKLNHYYGKQENM